jgi:hypothetical protein
VKGKKHKNLAASVRERLTQAAKRDGEDFQYILTRYALERLLYRLSKSEHAANFVLKGALLFQYWTRTAHRSTRDLDLLSNGSPSVSHFEEVFRQVCGEFLIAAMVTRTAPPPEASQWVASREAELYRKLAKHGLVAPRAEAASSALAAFLDRYIEGRTDVKPNTRAHLKRARNNLVDYFGAEKPLSEITPGDTDDFRVRLLQTLADNTVRRICGRAKQFFRAAVRKRLIAESPFADMKGTGVRANKSREHFVTREVAEKVLAACPDPEWKLLFALSRYGGLRCPCEHLALCWSDVDWDLGRITVRSPKTEHTRAKNYYSSVSRTPP